MAVCYASYTRYLIATYMYHQVPKQCCKPLVLHKHLLASRALMKLQRWHGT